MAPYRVIGRTRGHQHAVAQRHVYDFRTLELAQGFFRVSTLTAVWIGWELVNMRTHEVMETKGDMG
jgi:hypothetical protein